MNNVEGSLAAETIAAVEKAEDGTVCTDTDTRVESYGRNNIKWERILSSIDVLQGKILAALEGIPFATILQKKVISRGNSLSLHVALRRGRDEVFVEIDALNNRMNASILSWTMQSERDQAIEETA